MGEEVEYYLNQSCLYQLLYVLSLNNLSFLHSVCSSKWSREISPSWIKRELILIHLSVSLATERKELLTCKLILEFSDA